MAWVAVAGIAVTAVGAGVSAYGAAKNAEAIGDANSQNAYSEEQLYGRQSKKLNQLINQKEKKLYDIGNIFDRFKSSGAFGDTETLKNLRKAQEDFSQLAAGDFTGFEAQLRKGMSDALINTVGTGSPVGSYAELAADTQMQMRQQGIQSSVGISEFLSNEASKLLGAEFGIMDQRFQNQYEMDRTRVSNVANFNLGEAATQGVGMVAAGNALTQVGSSVASYGMYRQGLNTQNEYLGIAKQQAAAMQANSSRGNVPNYTPQAYNGPAVNLSPAAPAGGFNANPTLPGDAPVYNSTPTDPLMTVDPGWYRMYPNSPYKYNYQQMNNSLGDGVLPPLSSNSSILSSLGASIARA